MEHSISCIRASLLSGKADTPAHRAINLLSGKADTPAHRAINLLSGKADTPAHRAINLLSGKADTPAHRAINLLSGKADTPAHRAINLLSGKADTPAHRAINLLSGKADTPAHRAINLLSGKADTPAHWLINKLTDSRMPFYCLRRHVVYDPAYGQTREVWGVDRPFGSPALKTVGAPRDTDADDPLRVRECGCPYLLTMGCGRAFVTWDNIWSWLSLADDAGYTVVSRFKKMSPYSVIVLNGP